ncbi:MAG: hypothetical protein ACE5E6_04870 [Phycisphaerae bacterium]
MVSARAGAAIALLIGVVAAVRRTWLCDDAFISFRYAANLVDGLGLVFNAGERVEGYTNFLWTIWIAVGMRVGVGPEAWAPLWGIVCYAGSIALLVGLHYRLRRCARARALGVPVAALLAALHADWQVYATGGLETSCFTFLALAGFALVTGPRSVPRRAAVAGVVFALATMTRPDGMIFAVLGGGYVLWVYRPRLPAAVAYVGAFAVLWGAHTAWRIHYYGDFFPNTYYAKSANLTWYAQGWVYVRLYFARYWILLAALPVAGAVLHLCRSTALPASPRPAPTAPANTPGDRAASAMLLAAVMALAYTWYVMRVGGDFMFARLLIPATPFYLIVLEHGMCLLTAPHRPPARGDTPDAHASPRPAARPAAANRIPTPARGSVLFERLRVGVPAVAVVWFVLILAAEALERRPGHVPAGVPHRLLRMLNPLPTRGHISGIVNEPLYYPAEDMQRARQRGLTVRPFFDGLPITIAYYGGEARFVYYSRVAVAVEGAAGLTDRFVAHQPLARRGRVGHEKKATADYLLNTRNVHFLFSRQEAEPIHAELDDAIPWAIIHFSDTVAARVLHWDPRIMAAMKQRGARFDDITARIDAAIGRMHAVRGPITMGSPSGGSPILRHRQRMGDGVATRAPPAHPTLRRS